MHILFQQVGAFILRIGVDHQGQGGAQHGQSDQKDSGKQQEVFGKDIAFDRLFTDEYILKRHYLFLGLKLVADAPNGFQLPFVTDAL